MGFENYIPPFKNTRGFDILKGVNYASGAAGIRDETGMTQVILYFVVLKFVTNRNVLKNTLEYCLEKVKAVFNIFLNLTFSGDFLFVLKM